MRLSVLVTGGTGVVGEAAVTELVERGHKVRLLSRNASDDVERWGSSVEAWPASVTEPERLKGCADGIDGILHIAGIVA